MLAVIDEIRRWFEACGYVVSEQVGAVEGTVDRFATPRHGLMPPRTWLTVVASFPGDLDAAHEALDIARASRGADRALAIVTDDVTPTGYRPDLNGGIANYVSLRYLALHLAGVFDELRGLAGEQPVLPHFPHRLRGETVDACDWIETWIEEGTEGQLELKGGPFEAISEVVRETARRRATRFLAQPDQLAPIVFASSGTSPGTLKMLLERGWAVHAAISSHGEETMTIRRLGVLPDLPDSFSEREEQLAEPSVDDALAWFRSSAPEVPADPLRWWFLRDELARRLFRLPILRMTILHFALREPRSTLDDSWLPRVLAHSFQQVLEVAPRRTDPLRRIWIPAEEAALREFALGEPNLTELQGGGLRALRDLGLLVADTRSPRGMGRRYAFACTSVRDWFLARKIARDVRAGNRDILARYVFPRVEVGLFLAVIAPDVAALASSDRAEDLRRDVELEVARRVELTLGHQLNRSIGAIGAHAKTVRRALRESDIDDRTRTAFARIDEELEHLRKLTERSRLLNEAKEWESASLSLSDIVVAVIEPLRERHAGVDVAVAVSPDVTVRAAGDGLREILHCIVENAFHSVCALPEDKPRKIEIVAEREGETVRMRLKDNGIGVRPEDRERIFEPFVTTKTGGPGRPRGTGLGLSIARTFAERMGAKVTLESSNGETVFVMVFVAGE